MDGLEGLREADHSRRPRKGRPSLDQLHLAHARGGRDRRSPSSGAEEARARRDETRLSVGQDHLRCGTALGGERWEPEHDVDLGVAHGGEVPIDEDGVPARSEAHVVAPHSKWRNASPSNRAPFAESRSASMCVDNHSAEHRPSERKPSGARAISSQPPEISRASSSARAVRSGGGVDHISPNAASRPSIRRVVQGGGQYGAERSSSTSTGCPRRRRIPRSRA